MYDSCCDETSVAVACAAAAAAARGRSCINHRNKAVWGPDAAAAAAVLIIALKLLLLRKNPYVFGNIIVPRGIILLTLQILIDRSIKLEMMFTEYVWGLNHI